MLDQQVTRRRQAPDRSNMHREAAFKAVLRVAGHEQHMVRQTARLASAVGSLQPCIRKQSINLTHLTLRLKEESGFRTQDDQPEIRRRLYTARTHAEAFDRWLHARQAALRADGPVQYRWATINAPEARAETTAAADLADPHALLRLRQRTCGAHPAHEAY